MDFSPYKIPSLFKAPTPKRIGEQSRNVKGKDNFAGTREKIKES